METYAIQIDISAPRRAFGQTARNLVFGYDNVTVKHVTSDGTSHRVELQGSKSDLMHVLRRYFTNDQESAEAYFADRARLLQST